MNTTIFNRPSLSEYAKPALVAFVTVAFAILAAVGTSKVVGPLPLSISQVTTNKMSSFDVSGESELITVPDQAEVSVGISTRESTVAVAQDRANTVINAISQAVRQLGVEDDDIKTLDYSIYPEYDYESPTRAILGYSVNTTLRIKVKDLQQINQVIDTATANGANQVNGVQFSLSEEKENELTSQARAEAIADAHANAEELADLADMKLGKVINLYEQPPFDYQPPMYAMGANMARDAVAESTAIEPGSTTFTYRVTLSYETL